MPHKNLGPVILDFAGVEMLVEDRELLLHPQVGGLILFSRNYECPQQLKELLKSIRSARSELVVAVDHEGGRVQRFRDGFTRIPPMQKLGQLCDDNPEVAFSLARDVGWLLASELLSFGIDISYAPVLDVDDCLSDIIGDRSFSADPNRVTAMCRALIEGMHDAGMASTGKHFPGHGGVKQDSHLELPCDQRELSEIELRDLVPFVELFDDLDALMPAHIVFPAVDNLPVGFSKVWLQSILREKYSYDGVIFSDDLSMEGAVSVGGFQQRAELALNAGCDSVLVCNNRRGAEQVVEHLERKDFRLSTNRLNRMQRRREVDDRDLKASERWIKTRKKLELLV